MNALVEDGKVGLRAGMEDGQRRLIVRIRAGLSPFEDEAHDSASGGGAGGGGDEDEDEGEAVAVDSTTKVFNGATADWLENGLAGAGGAGASSFGVLNGW